MTLSWPVFIILICMLYENTLIVFVAEKTDNCRYLYFLISSILTRSLSALFHFFISY